MRYSKAKHSGEQDFELNIASIIDCFTVLITYMLVSASFIALGVLDVNDLTQRSSADTAPEPKVSLSIQVNRRHDITMRLTGESEKSAPVVIPPKDGVVDRDAMLTTLEGIKQKFPDLDAAVLSAASGIEYDEIVKVIDSSKKFIPNITLGERAD
jgi:biopolymer transport protein ExbD